MLARVRAQFSILLLALWSACDKSAAPGEPAHSAGRAVAPASGAGPAGSSSDPVALRIEAAPRTAQPGSGAGQEPAPASAAPPPAGRAAAKSLRTATWPRPPAGGCVVRSQQPLSQDAERVIALSVGGRPAVIVFEGGGRTLALWTPTTEVDFVRVTQLALDAKLQRGAALCSAARCELALVDERARLLSVRLEQAQFSSPRSLASGLDRRFAPALAQAGERLLYAYTASVGETMHTFWIESSAGKSSAPRDLTPAGHGAAAPAFVLHAKQPILVVIDAHAGISPLLELSFAATGGPGEARVRSPVSQPYDPPLLAAVEWRSGDVEVVYTAIGRLAMTAIGRVLLRQTNEPTALSASKGYGELSFGAARSRKRALFAIEVPLDSKPDAQREISLKLLDGMHTGDGPSFGADARQPSVASLPEAGSYLVTFVRSKTAHAVLVDCDD